MSPGVPIAHRTVWLINCCCLFRTDCEVSNVDSLSNGTNNFLPSIRNTSHSRAVNPIRACMDSSFPHQRHAKYTSCHKYLQKRKNRYLCPSIFKITQLQIRATRRIWRLTPCNPRLLQFIYASCVFLSLAR